MSTIIKEEQIHCQTIRYKYVLCNYCGLKRKPDQRENQLIGWAKISIKQVNYTGIFKDKSISYFKSDMCPDCIQERRINEISTGGK